MSWNFISFQVAVSVCTKQQLTKGNNQYKVQLSASTTETADGQVTTTASAGYQGEPYADDVQLSASTTETADGQVTTTASAGYQAFEESTAVTHTSFGVRLVTEESHDVQVKNALGKIIIDSNINPEHFSFSTRGGDVETVVKIGLKDYDPQKDKRFSGTMRLPHIPRPKLKVCMLGDRVSNSIRKLHHYSK
ncbi:hypothetical protein CTI12_AA496780 [Artemisia annua]|uniref:Uncharacterized protein n=1 Tax=Artemisia annua TaxID=35608 RepID=A0A2U1LFM1_ARTAN|nr:hypothetical protein CTI12_AA496780 [Artemisia annua]